LFRNLRFVKVFARSQWGWPRLGCFSRQRNCPEVSDH
jgi:hypothetical protein